MDTMAGTPEAILDHDMTLSVGAAQQDVGAER